MPLSTAPLPARDRLIFALDVPTYEEGVAWVERLGDAVTFYKLGLEFCMGGRYFELISELLARGKKVFADLKFSDVPATVSGAVRNLAALRRHLLHAPRNQQRLSRGGKGPRGDGFGG